MNLLDRAIAVVSPRSGLERARSRAATGALMHYAAAATGRRANSWSLARQMDADTASSRRQIVADRVRDMVRNSPYAARAQMVIGANVIGDGIIPKVTGGGTRESRAFTAALRAHVDSVSIDADGRSNLYGLQRLVLATIVESGECLVRRRWRKLSDGLPLPVQLQVLEPDYIDTGKDGTGENGNLIREGIEYDAIGRRVAYWLFREHPGSRRRFATGAWESIRYPASDILHVYRQDRPGQMRGVSWFAPVAMMLQDLEDYQDAQLMRQKIAACFAAFRITPNADMIAAEEADGVTKIVPGMVHQLAPGEDVRFADPPGLDGYDTFVKTTLRAIASGMGMTAEALTGDLSDVNFSSGRMGRMEFERNISAWQWLMLIPQMMQPLARWLVDGWALKEMRTVSDGLSISWTPPRRILIDPNREISALKDQVRAGFTSRQSVIREFGFDPDEVLAEQIEDARSADAAGLVFDTDVRPAKAGIQQMNGEGSNATG